MQDAYGGWLRQRNFPAEMLASLYELNLRFLDLASAREGAWHAPLAIGLPGCAAQELSPMTPAQRAAAAHCPYALFDIRFNDEAHWLARLCGAGSWRIADEPGATEDVANFVRLALFYAWHVASTAKHSARLVLGMSERTAEAFRGATLNCLPALVASETSNLSARWCTSAAYWNALLGAAARRDAHRLHRVQLLGVQLAAAALLP